MEYREILLILRTPSEAVFLIRSYLQKHGSAHQHRTRGNPYVPPCQYRLCRSPGDTLPDLSSSAQLHRTETGNDHYRSGRNHHDALGRRPLLTDQSALPAGIYRNHSIRFRLCRFQDHRDTRRTKVKLL